MLKLIELNEFTRGLTNVTQADIFVGNTSQFNPEGLFSDKIFGVKDTPERRKNFSYIELNCKVLHPVLMPVIRRLNRKILEAMSGEKRFTLTNGILAEDPRGEFQGMTKVVKELPNLDFQSGDKQKNGERQSLIDMLKWYIKKDQVFIDKCIVIPAAYRDVQIMQDGTQMVPEINEYYMQMIRLSASLKSLRGGDLYDALAYKMYKTVLEYVEFIEDKLSKKEGLIRSSILGKRVDFSGRGVIVGSAAEIKPNELGIPFKQCIKLYEPFILYELLNSGRMDRNVTEQQLRNYNGASLQALSIRKLFDGIYKGDELPNDLMETLKTAVRFALKGKVVIAKRDPVLHAEQVKAFYPVLVDGSQIKIYPQACSQFNADFDGDTMALYVPVTNESIQECKDRLMVHISKDGMDKLSDDFSKDLVYGVFQLTKGNKDLDNLSVQPSEFKYNDLIYTDKNLIINFNGIRTTVGRAIFNIYCMRKTNLPFVNKTIDKKVMNSLAAEVYNKCGKEIYIEFVDMAMKLSYYYGTVYTRSLTIDDLMGVPKDIEHKKDELKKLAETYKDNRDKMAEKAQEIINEITKEISKYATENNTSLGEFGDSGCLKGGWGQSVQIVGCKGLTADNKGNTLDPISQSYSDGLNSRDFFYTGSGTRKGISDRVLNTATTGYMTRQIVYAMQRVEADEKIFDCGTKAGVRLKVTPDIGKRLKGRYIIENGQTIPFDPSYIGKEVTLRSPVRCKSTALCRKCYGDLLMRNNTPYVGILAGTIIGERGSQLIMQSFHSGGAVKISIPDVRSMAITQFTDDKISLFDQAFYQQSLQFFSKYPVKIILNKDVYIDPKKHITITNDKIYMAYGYFDVYIGNKKFDFTIDCEMEFDRFNCTIEKDDEQYLIISMKSPGVLFNVKPQSDNFLQKVKYGDQILNGKQPWKTPTHFLLKIYDFYKDITNCDMVHFEVVASQLLRDKGNPMIPARLNPTQYNPQIIRLKSIPDYESYLTSMAFENFSKAITTGLTYENIGGQSIIEKIMTGEF